LGQHQSEHPWYHTSVSQALTVCRRLRSLSIGCRHVDHFDIPESHLAAQTLAEWLTTASALEDLYLDVADYLSPLTLQLLSSLPRLEQLTLGHFEDISTSPEEHIIREGFKSLRHLHLYVPIPVVAEVPRFDWSLSSFEVTAYNVTTSPRDLKRWLSESNGNYGRNLKDFSLHVQMEEPWDGDALVPFVSGIGLTRLVVDIEPDFNICDQTLEGLGSALPSLEELVIPRYDTGGKATVWGVLRLLGRCTKMKLLEMEFNAVVEGDDIRSRTLPKSNLTQLHVGSSPIGGADLVAELFGKVFTQLESLTWDGTEDRNNWELVQRAVQLRGGQGPC
jgi:hypothetical protein